jgi:hypothetical protein
MLTRWRACVSLEGPCPMSVAFLRQLRMDNPQCGSGTNLWWAAYAVAFVPALLLSDSRDYYGGRFEWGIFWSLGLVVPTIVAALILLISWVIRAASAVQQDRRPPTRSRHRR